MQENLLRVLEPITVNGNTVVLMMKKQLLIVQCCTGISLALLVAATAIWFELSLNRKAPAYTASIPNVTSILLIVWIGAIIHAPTIISVFFNDEYWFHNQLFMP